MTLNRCQCGRLTIEPEFVCRVCRAREQHSPDEIVGEVLETEFDEITAARISREACVEALTRSIRRRFERHRLIEPAEREDYHPAATVFSIDDVRDFCVDLFERLAGDEPPPRIRVERDGESLQIFVDVILPSIIIDAKIRLGES